MTGRCEGCGTTGPVPKVGEHILQCAAWQKLYAADPALALSPEESYRRWQEGGKDEARGVRIAAAVELENRLLAAAAARFSRPKDILED